LYQFNKRRNKVSRTYRSNPTAKRRYNVSVAFHNGEYVPLPWGEDKFLSKGGWKEAKRLLSKEDYAYHRILRGDKLTHYLGNGGVVWWYRNAIEKRHRFHTRREIHRYMRNPDYEVMTCERPDGAEYYYWY
jgi:hypothetical protein